MKAEEADVETKVAPSGSIKIESLKEHPLAKESDNPDTPTTNTSTPGWKPDRFAPEFVPGLHKHGCADADNEVPAEWLLPPSEMATMDQWAYYGWPGWESGLPMGGDGVPDENPSATLMTLCGAWGALSSRRIRSRAMLLKYYACTPVEEVPEPLRALKCIEPTKQQA